MDASALLGKHLPHEADLLAKADTPIDFRKRQTASWLLLKQDLRLMHRSMVHIRR